MPEVKLPKKISESSIDSLIQELYKGLNDSLKNNELYLIDGSQLQWASNSGLLMLTAFLGHLYAKRVNFKYFFLKEGSSQNLGMSEVLQLIELWETWQIYTVVPEEVFEDYFDIDSNFVNQLKKNRRIRASHQREIYNRYGITPFLALPFIDQYHDDKIYEALGKIYTLSDATREILETNNLIFPFNSKTISAIVTKELYENFLDHFSPQPGSVETHKSFMSLALRGRIRKGDNIQGVLKKNFNEEELIKTKPFFFDDKSKGFRNRALLELSFLDWGLGIPYSLRDAFIKESPDMEGMPNQVIDSEILRFSFEPYSSRHPINVKYKTSTGADEIIVMPRGLFDLLTIVKRFSGLIIIRSRNGKIFYDFSKGKTIEEAFGVFGNPSQGFPGTFISIYIPEIFDSDRFDFSSIKPEISGDYSFKKAKEKFLSLREIQNNLRERDLDKDVLYDELFFSLIKLLKTSEETITYIDFEGFEIDRRITKKIIFFLSSDYSINRENNVLILNPPPKKLLEEMKIEIATLSSVDQKFKFHPTPFIFQNKDTFEIEEIFWLGVFSEEDTEVLGNILFREFSVAKSDFEEPDQVQGNALDFDTHGNLITCISSDRISKHFWGKYESLQREQLIAIVQKSQIKRQNSVFLCSGNYYQHIYLLLFDALSNPSTCDFLAEYLIRKVKVELRKVEQKLSDFKFLSITQSSKKLLDSLEKLEFISSEQILFWEVESDIPRLKNPLESLKSSDKVILICDVISTGFMAKFVDQVLSTFGTCLSHIGVVVNAIDLEFTVPGINTENWDTLTINLHKLSIRKYSRKELQEELLKNELSVIRINPYTNTPIEISEKATLSEDTVLVDNSEFLKLIDDAHLKAGYFEFNHSIHPYFFDMRGMLKDIESANNLLKHVFSRVPNEVKEGAHLVLYPQNSGFRNIDKDFFRNNILKNHDVQFFELDRIGTSEGWRFPHPPQFIESFARSKNVLILDDGSCSGESIIQMVDEVMFLNIKAIYVVTLIGRISDYKKEFFSRIKSLSSGEAEGIGIKIFFGSHWHIPTYNLNGSLLALERAWLRQVNEMGQVPEFIHRITNSISEELNFKELEAGNNKFLIAKPADLIIFRDLIGRMAEYRFFKEYFDFFDDILNGFFPLITSKVDTTTLEMICGVFMHEPYLFPKIKKTLPDLAELIRNLAFGLVFEGTKFENQSVRLQDLRLNWDSKNILHLFFISISDHGVSHYLNSERVEELLRKYCEKKTDVDYILYRILRYYPVGPKLEKRESIVFKKPGVHLDSVLIALLERAKLPAFVIKRIKRFRAFTSLLNIEDESFDDQLKRVYQNYNELIDGQNHEDSVSALQDALLGEIDTGIEMGLSSELISSILGYWERIDPFYGAIFRLDKSFPEFLNCFGKHCTETLRKGESSLESSYKKVWNRLTQDHILVKELIGLKEEIEKLFLNLNEVDSRYFKIFISKTTPEPNNIFETFFQNLKDEFPEFEIVSESVSTSKSIYVPQSLIVDRILPEIQKNMRYADSECPIQFNFEIQDSILLMTISNSMRKDMVKTFGSNKGTLLFRALNLYPEEIISYSQFENEGKYTQKLKFELI